MVDCNESDSIEEGNKQSTTMTVLTWAGWGRWPEFCKSNYALEALLSRNLSPTLHPRTGLHQRENDDDDDSRFIGPMSLGNRDIKIKAIHTKLLNCNQRGQTQNCCNHKD